VRSDGNGGGVIVMGAAGAISRRLGGGNDTSSSESRSSSISSTRRFSICFCFAALGLRPGRGFSASIVSAGGGRHSLTKSGPNRGSR